MKIFKNRIFLILMVGSVGSAALGMVNPEPVFKELPQYQGIDQATLKGDDALRGGICSLGFGNNGKMVSCSEWGLGGCPGVHTTIKLWDANTGKCVKTLKNNIKMSPVVFSPDRTILACGCDDGIMRILDANTLECIRSTKLKCVSKPERYCVEDKVRVCSLAFSPDGKKLAIACGDGICREEVVRVLNTKTLKCVYELKHDCLVCKVAFSPDGKFLASGDINGVVRRWDTKLHACILESKLDNYILSLVFSPDGKFLAAAINDIIYIYDRIGLYTIIRNIEFAKSTSFSPDSTIFAFGSRLTGDLVLVDLAFNAYVMSTNIHSRVCALAFSSDGLYFAVGAGHDIHLYKNLLWQPIGGQLGCSWGAAFAPRNK